MQRYDFARLPKIKKTDEGFLEAPQTYIASTGPQTYQHIDGSSHIELRLPEDVFSESALASIERKPVTVDHPQFVKSDNAERHAVGSASNARKDGAFLAADLTLWSDRAVDAAEHGISEISLGYQVNLEPIPGGVFKKDGHPLNGTRADFLQRDIRVNHIALVHRGRSNQGRQDRPVRLRLDSAGHQILGDSAPMEKVDMEEEITIGGVVHKVSKEVADAYKADAEARQAVLSKEQARADAAEAEVKTLEDKQSDETRQDAELKRLSLLTKVSQITGEEAADLVKLDEEALHSKAIVKLDSSLVLEGKDAVYKSSLFDYLSGKQVKQDAGAEISAALNQSSGSEIKQDSVSPLATAFKETQSRLYRRTKAQ